MSRARRTPQRPRRLWRPPLESLYAREDDRVRRRWRRSLPLGELLFDRWRRARRLGFGAGTSIYHHSYVFGDVAVGENTWIGPYTLLDGSGCLRIGSWCSISAGVQIYTHSTVRWAVTGGGSPYEYAPVAIGDRCFIGPLSVVAAGVDVGDGCVIGAHSYVDADLPPGVVAVGAPARIVRAAEA